MTDGGDRSRDVAGGLAGWRRGRGGRGGFTLTEVMTTVAVVSIVGLVAYALLNTATVLYAKSVSINMSGMKMRTAVDRTLQSIYLADAIPALLDAGGTEIGRPLDTAAAGISFTVDGGTRRLLWVAGNELRYSRSGDPADYDILNAQVLGSDGGNTPFRIVQVNSRIQLAIDLRIRETTYDGVLTLYEGGASNAYFRVNTMMRPRNMVE